MKIIKLSDLQKKDALSLLLAIASDEGRIDLHKIHQQTIQAIGYYILKIEVSISDISPTFSVASHISDKDIQVELLHLAGPLIFLENQHKEDRALALERLAKKWKHNDQLVKSIYKAAKGHKNAMFLCELRPTKAETGASALYQSFFLVASKLDFIHHKELYERYTGYGQLPEGTFGRTLFEYYQDNEFSLPGTPNSEVNDILIRHDIHHVLSGYDTTPLGEIDVLAFDGAISKVDFSAQIGAATAQFQIGYTIADPTINSWINQFNPDSVYHAYQRGMETKINYIDGKFDFTPYMKLPLSEVRKKFNISEEGMRVNSSKDKWCGPYGPPSKRKNPNLVKKPKHAIS